LEEGTLSEFKTYDELYLLRFLRARKFDIEKSNLMFTDFMKWRTENNVDDIEVLLFYDLNKKCLFFFCLNYNFII
jgi:hypothetical protein